MPKEEDVEPKKEPSEPTAPTAAKNLTLENTSSSAAASASAASAPPKRTFVPNVGVQRVKKEVPEPSNQQQKGGNRKPAQPNLKAAAQRGGARGSVGNIGGRGDNLIQSHSIFEAGPGASSASSAKRYGGDRESYESTTRLGSSSSLGGGGGDAAVKKEPGGAKSDQQRALKIDEQMLVDEQKQLNGEPVYFDLKIYRSKIKSIKEEAVKVDEASSAFPELEPTTTTTAGLVGLKNIFDPIDPNEKSQEKLVLFQIPETFGLSEMTDEGHIGKLRLRKSGRVELCINQNKILDVSKSVCASFLQDAFALEIKDDQTSGKFVNLGHVETKIVASHRI